MTTDEAQQWLAGLEKDCPNCIGCQREHNDDPTGVCACLNCHGTGKVPVLDLREPRGRDNLHAAMQKDGWCCRIIICPPNIRVVRFGKPPAYAVQGFLTYNADTLKVGWPFSEGSDDWVAAAEAMKKARKS